MKAAITQRMRQIELCDVAAPAPGVGQALVRVEKVGLCGSDKHLYLGTHPYSRYPLIQGHELSGTIESLPPDYEGGLRLGVRVAIEPVISCGSCYPCLHDQRGACIDMQCLGAHLPGGLQELTAVPVRLLHPTTLPDELAALVEPMSIGVHAAARARIAPDDEVLVLGAGPIGLSVLFGARQVGARALLVDPLDNRLELAERLGADVLKWSGISTTVQRGREWARHGAPTVAVDATGLAEAVRAAFDVVISAGRVVIVGQTKQDVALPISIFTGKELNVVGAQNSSGIFARTVSLVEQDPTFVAQMISHRFPFCDVREAFEFTVANPDKTVKVLIDLTTV